MITSTQKVDLPKSWLKELEGEFSKDYMKNLKSFLKSEISNGETVYPHGKNIFSAFNKTPFNKVKVVIIGQDPYHGEGQAHGLSFSVPKGIRTPPSLLNIYKEINREFGHPIPNHGNLEYWSKQGVLLLNAVLTVRANQAASHQKKGWENFTDKVVESLNQDKEGLVFLLWGSHAQKKGASIDTSKHLVLKSPHPSPLSAHRGFLGNNHFKKANEYLTSIGKEAIDWKIY